MCVVILDGAQYAFMLAYIRFSIEINVKSKYIKIRLKSKLILLSVGAFFLFSSRHSGVRKSEFLCNEQAGISKPN